MLFGTVAELKTVLDITDAVEDAKLTVFLTTASAWIEEWLGRGDLTKTSRTEYYGGSGTTRLVLKHRPIFIDPEPTVYLDEAGWFGAPDGSFDDDTELTYGTHFVPKLDTFEGALANTSRCGILLRIDDVWPKPAVRQRGLLSPFLGEAFGTIKVTYTAGYTDSTLPPQLKLAAQLIASRLLYLFPLGVPLNGESYEERSVSMLVNEKRYLMTLVAPLLWPYRNHSRPN